VSAPTGLHGTTGEQGTASAAAAAVAPRIAVVDYGMGNRRSVEKALLHVGAEAVVTDDPEALRAADGLLLPGVGAFPAAMEAIRARGLDRLLRELARAGSPVLGACLGMQLLFERSCEHGGADGLGLLRGEVGELDARGLKLPHIGWSAVRWRAHDDVAGAATVRALRDDLPETIYLYHVHSFVVRPADPEVVLATAEYGEAFAAIVGRGSIFGTQSHPEKSSAHGLRLLASFAALCAARAAGGAPAGRPERASPR
jgi:glutamine amidotransferase